MNLSEFIERYQAVEPALQAYVETLPLWVNIWRAWMFFIFTASVVFVIRKPEARWLAVVMVVSIVAYNAVAAVSGIGRFPSVAFVVLWTPLAIDFARRWPPPQPSTAFERLYVWWFGATLSTLWISLAFDAYNVAYSLIAGVP